MKTLNNKPLIVYILILLISFELILALYTAAHLNVQSNQHFLPLCIFFIIAHIALFFMSWQYKPLHTKHGTIFYKISQNYDDMPTLSFMRWYDIQYLFFSFNNKLLTYTVDEYKYYAKKLEKGVKVKDISFETIYQELKIFKSEYEAYYDMIEQKTKNKRENNKKASDIIDEFKNFDGHIK